MAVKKYKKITPKATAIKSGMTKDEAKEKLPKWWEFQPGNQFWKKRSIHGRDRIIKSPEILWQAACEYFDECEKNPIISYDYKGKDADKVRYEHPKPFKKSELAMFCGIATWETIEELKAISNDFSEVITCIEEIIYNQKYEGATSGLMTPLIIARDLGLAEKTENKNKTEAEIRVNLSVDKIKEISKSLEDEV